MERINLKIKIIKNVLIYSIGQKEESRQGKKPRWADRQAGRQAGR